MIEILKLVAITLLPFLELRASIPYGILSGMHWLPVFLVCVITNIVLGILIFFLLDKFVHIVIKFKPLGKLYNRIVERTQKKIHNSVDRWGELGVALFIGIPLPGSGVYSGALGAYLLGLSYKKFIIANIIGVIIAGIAVTLIMVLGDGALSFFIKLI